MDENTSEEDICAMKIWEDVWTKGNSMHEYS